ncbi:MAG: 16S rRNA (guanine(966)-N(2))-methyltransferase RsmD [Gemmatimonadota bacterium]|nr:16S rRNA (guanine(966)-N(2))-methyltransferase RsmD [Gemmatimonadota bacterium]
MSLRIIAGEFSGRPIEAPSGRVTRPTADRVREAWFSALGSRVRGASVLDLFAGSGALGLEALSRGAHHAHFVESDRRALAALRANVASLGLADRTTVVRRDAFRFVRSVRKAFDLALADPPYGTGAGPRLLRTFTARPFASELWLEHAPSHDLAATAIWTRRYGDTQLSAYRSSIEPGDEPPPRELEAE